MENGSSLSCVVENSKEIFFGLIPLDSFLIILSIIVAAFATIGTIIHGRIISNKRAAFDLFIHRNKDQDLKDAISVLSPHFHDENSNLAQFANNKSSPEYRALMDFIGWWEFIAVVTREGAFDEKIFKRMYGTLLLTDYDKCRGFIAQIRAKTRNDRIYQEFEWLAKKWGSKPIKVDNGNNRSAK